MPAPPRRRQPPMLAFLPEPRRRQRAAAFTTLRSLPRRRRSIAAAAVAAIYGYYRAEIPYAEYFAATRALPPAAAPHSQPPQVLLHQVLILLHIVGEPRAVATHTPSLRRRQLNAATSRRARRCHYMSRFAGSPAAARHAGYAPQILRFASIQPRRYEAFGHFTAFLHRS